MPHFRLHHSPLVSLSEGISMRSGGRGIKFTPTGAKCKTNAIRGRTLVLASLAHVNEDAEWVIQGYEEDSEKT